MLKKLGRVALMACVTGSAAAFADDTQDQPAKAPQALTDAQLDAITAAGVTVIISNPGNGQTFHVRHGNFICINCGGPSDTTNGVIITPKGKFIVIPGGPL